MAVSLSFDEFKALVGPTYTRDTAELTQVYEVAVEFVDRRAPDAPTAISNECVLRFGSALSQSGWDNPDSVRVEQLWYSTGCGLLTKPFIHRRAAVIRGA